MRTPREIADDCENLHGGEYMWLLREAAETIRRLEAHEQVLIEVVETLRAERMVKS